MRRATLTSALAAIAATGLASCNLIETEGRAEDARSTLIRYLNAVGGASDDRGWSLLSDSMREGYGERDDYVELAETADAPLPINEIQLTSEDDGFYAFSVTTDDPIDLAYAELLFRPRELESSIGCPTGPGEFEMTVLIAPFTEHDGVSGTGCKAQD